MIIETDKTNFAQSLMHTIKGNLGTGILGMAGAFAHAGLISGTIGLPILCIIATYCVNLLVRSSQHLESKMKWINLDYAELAKGSFKCGPKWMKPYSGLMCNFIDFILIINQLGICCVYLVFVKDNLITILKTYQVFLEPSFVYLTIFPFILLLSYIRTLKRLSYASSAANIFQFIGIIIILQHLIKTLNTQDIHIEYVKPASEIALGFGTAMFAFEGISVILPIYTRMKHPEKMGGCFGIINLSYTILLVLYFTMGLIGYLKYGSDSKGSITLNLPQEILYDCVRGIFVSALVLTYPLQFYVPYEIIWEWLRTKLFIQTDKIINQHHYQINNQQLNLDVSVNINDNDNNINSSNKNKNKTFVESKQLLRCEYVFRTILVLVTFLFAYYIPNLLSLMELVGSISGTALSITLPALVHMATFWEDTSGSSKVFMVIVDVMLILFGIFAGAIGSYFSFIAIIDSGTNKPSNI